MATRGSALSRALKYFRECDVDEARVAATLVNEIVARRVDGVGQVGSAKPEKRKRRARAGSVGGLANLSTAAHETLADA